MHEARGRAALCSRKKREVATAFAPKRSRAKALIGQTRAAYTMGVTLLFVATQYGRRHKKPQNQSAAVDF